MAATILDLLVGVRPSAGRQVEQRPERFDRAHVTHVLFVVHGEDRVAEWFAGFITKTLGLPAWAPKSGESFDLISGRLPAAHPAMLERPGRKEIQEAFDALEAVLSGVDVVVNRLREHARQLDMESKPQQSIRLADAVIRLTNDLETLRSRWDPNGKSKSPAE